MNKNDIKSFLDKYKSYIGFGNYSVSINKHKRVAPDKVAQVFTNPFSKELVIDIYGDFDKNTEEGQKELLIHELVHGRIRLKEFKVSRYKETIEHDEEEHMVNDLTKFVYHFIKGNSDE